MTLIQAILLGLIQGLTEFIPISSTAHLLIIQELLKIPPSDAMFSFLVIIQLGTIVSLVIYFWTDLVEIVRAMYRSLIIFLGNIRDRMRKDKKRRRRKKEEIEFEARLGWLVLLATVPALVAGYLLQDAVKSLFRLPLLEAGIRLLITAVLLALAEGLGRRSHSLHQITWWKALIIGAAQILSVFPGASRSGTTIGAGMACKIHRRGAARFAFLMAIPVMLAAGGYQMLEVLKMPGLASFAPMLAIGFVTAGAVGWLAVKWLMHFLRKRSLYPFAWYCALAGLVVIFIFVT